MKWVPIYLANERRRDRSDLSSSDLDGGVDEVERILDALFAEVLPRAGVRVAAAAGSGRRGGAGRVAEGTCKAREGKTRLRARLNTK